MFTHMYRWFMVKTKSSKPGRISLLPSTADAFDATQRKSQDLSKLLFQAAHAEFLAKDAASCRSHCLPPQNEHRAIIPYRWLHDVAQPGTRTIWTGIQGHKDFQSWTYATCNTKQTQHEQLAFSTCPMFTSGMATVKSSQGSINVIQHTGVSWGWKQLVKTTNSHPRSEKPAIDYENLGSSSIWISSLTLRPIVHVWW